MAGVERLSGRWFFTSARGFGRGVRGGERLAGRDLSRGGGPAEVFRVGVLAVVAGLVEVFWLGTLSGMIGSVEGFRVLDEEEVCGSVSRNVRGCVGQRYGLTVGFSFFRTG